MKTILSIAFLTLFFFTNAQVPYYKQLTIVGAKNNDTIETNKEYLIIPTQKTKKKVRISAGGCSVELVFKNNNYYIKTMEAGALLTSISLNGKAIGPPIKFISIKK